MHDARSAAPPFPACVRELLCDAQVQQMHQIPQHVRGVDCCDHCLFVAWLAYHLCLRLGWDARAAARAGMLHDLYLCRWEDTDVGLWERLVIHPRMALENARRFGLSPNEEGIILTHMWPLNWQEPPRSREAVAVNLADKLSTFLEVTHLYRLVALHRRTAVTV